jgi:phospholipid/cholesterol/gamma-HCH transport system ATP-binding protein
MESEKNPPPVEVKGLTRSFGRQRVLDHLDLTVTHAETLAILGRSGVGKSVFLKLLIGLQKPDSVTIRIHGEDIAKVDIDRLNKVRKSIGFLFQQAALYDSLTVEENVAFPLRRHTWLSSVERRERVRDLLAKVGMENDFRKMPAEISGGIQKRVGLARALALDPAIVLFDEPTTGLDPITAGEIGDLILQMKSERNITSIVVTHDIHGAKSFADRMVMIHEGAILIGGTFEDLQRSPNKFVSRFLQQAA